MAHIDHFKAAHLLRRISNHLFIFIYLLHVFTQGKAKQMTLVFIGALHSFNKIVTNMYVQSIIQYSQIDAH